MRIVSITHTRNESEIIEAFARHHCALFDEMTIALHRCSDNTEEILSSLIAEGLPLRLQKITYSDGDVDGITPLPNGMGLHKHSGVMTDLMREAVSAGADWVFPLDVDEFVSARSRAALEEILQGANPSAALKMPWTTYVPTPEDDENEPHVLRRIVHRRTGKLGPMECKVAVPRLAALRENVMLANGHHFMVDPIKMDVDRGGPTPEIPLAHFPVRDERQLRNRIISAGLYFDCNPLGQQGWRRFQGQLWGRCVDPRPMTRGELEEIGLNYHREGLPPDTQLVRDPVSVLAPDLRYAVRSLPTWELLVESAEHIAAQVGKYARRHYKEAQKGLPPGGRTP